MANTWVPLLQGPLAARATGAVSDIAAALRPLGPSPPPALPGQSEELPDVSLAGGAAGIALFFHYLAGEGGGADRTTALELVDTAIEAVAARPMTAGLFSGFPGIAWAVDHVCGRRGDNACDGTDDDANGEIDAVLEERLAQTPWRGDYDLVSGLVGMGVYALDRLPRPGARRCLEHITERLAELSVDPTGQGCGGRSWHTPPELLPAWQRKLAPEGYFNLGLAHGVPGVIALLGAIVAAGVGKRRGRTLLDSAVTWLLAQRLGKESDAAFATWLIPRARPEPARSAWCYGDPGVAAALLAAARATGNREWEGHAIAIMRRAAQRDEKRSGVRDAGLCHGAAGLAHLFNRFYQATGDDLFASVARRRFEQTLMMRDPGGNLAGFRAFTPRDTGVAQWTDEPGFLTGAAGVGLALQAAICSTEPAWDRCLLLSIPPAAGATT